MKKIVTLLLLLSSILGWSQLGKIERPTKPKDCFECTECRQIICNYDGKGICKVALANSKGGKSTHVSIPTYNEGGVILAPNPIPEFADVVLEQTDFVVANNVQMIAYEILDSSGIVVQEEIIAPCQTYNLNASALAPGNYLLLIQLDQLLPNGDDTVEVQFIKE